MVGLSNYNLAIKFQHSKSQDNSRYSKLDTHILLKLKSAMKLTLPMFFYYFE